MKTVLSALVLAVVAAGITSAGPAETRIVASVSDGSYTDVKIEDNVVTIVVPLAVVYALSESDGPPPAEVVTFVQDGFAAGAAFWNAGFARLAGCFELRLQVDVVFTTVEGEPSAEMDRYHSVYPWHQNMAGTFPDGRGLPTVVYPRIPAGDLAGDADSTYPFDQFTVGYMPEWLFEDPWALAHELGHFFGLGDDYRDGGIIPGREGTLMGGTEGGDYIDQALIDDVAKLIEEAGYDLPKCITGTFLSADVSNTVSATQTFHSRITERVTFSLKPEVDGTVEGMGVIAFSAEATYVSNCEWSWDPVELSWPVKITGRFIGNVLSFELDPPTRTFPIRLAGSCGTSTFPYAASAFSGWSDIIFTDGIYEYTRDIPHGAPDTGNTHVELKLKQKKPE